MRFVCGNTQQDCSRAKYGMSLIPEDKGDPKCPECNSSLISSGFNPKKISKIIYKLRYLLIGLGVISTGFILFISLYEPPKEPEPEPEVSKAEDVMQNSSFEYKISFKNIDDLQSFEVVKMPDWLEYWPTDSLITGWPENSAVGSHRIEIQAISDDTDTIKFNVDFNVINVNDPPIFENIPEKFDIAEIDSTYRFSPIIIDPDNDTTTIEVISVPDWLKYDTLCGIADFRFGGI